MVSILLQERAAGFAVGVATGAAAYIHCHRELWRRTAETAETLSHQSLPPPPSEPVREPVFGPERQARLARAWNAAIDNTLGAAAQYLSERGL